MTTQPCAEGQHALCQANLSLQRTCDCPCHGKATPVEVLQNQVRMLVAQRNAAHARQIRAEHFADTLFAQLQLARAELREVEAQLEAGGTGWVCRDCHEAIRCGRLSTSGCACNETPDPVPCPTCRVPRTS